MMICTELAAAFLLLSASEPQEGKRPVPGTAHPNVDQAKVDASIKRGVAFLRGQVHAVPEILPELVLLTWLHAGVSERDPDFQKLFDLMMAKPLAKTYAVSLRAMVLEEIDRVRFQPRIRQCAQFLVDNQCPNGQWSYGEPSPFVEDVATGAAPAVASGPEAPAASRSKPKVVRKLSVSKKGDGPPTGDNSNSQYAALGLRACHDAGVQVSREVLSRARAWWYLSQIDDDKSRSNPYLGRGWCYGPKDHGHAAYGSMTAGAVASLCIYDMLLAGENAWKRDAAVASGLAWISQNFTVTANAGRCEHAPNQPAWMGYYYLYALERVGMLFGTERIGKREWYSEGAEHLLVQQKSDGSWISASPHGRMDPANYKVEYDRIWDTCFAILFLRRATRPLEDVASTDRFHPRSPK